MSERSRKSRRVPTTVTQMRWIARVATVEEEKEKKEKFPGGGDPERLLHSSMAVDDDHSERERKLNAVTIIVR